MKFVLLFLCAASLFLSQGVDGNDPFCYKEEEGCGPKSWGDDCNKGNNQSPIDIKITYDIISNAGKAQFYYNRDYSQNQDFILKNNGHTIQASVRPDLTSTCVLQGDEGSLANNRYVFSQLHFHWGSNKNQGTEHTFNNRSYAMEGHFVHYSSDYANLTDAVNSKKPNALAVVAVIYVLSNEDNTAFTPLLKAMKQLKKSGDSTQGTELNLLKLLPKQQTVYNFQYNGSLTTPGCAEVVLWNVIGNGARISETQLKQFRNQLDAHEKSLQNNFRPTQDLNGREVNAYETQIIRSNY